MRRAAPPIVCALVLAGSAPSALAQPESPAYRLEAGIDVPALVIPAVLSASWLLGPELEPPYCAPACDPETVNAIDRPAAGLYSARWATAGDVSTVAVLASMPIFLALAEPPGHALNDFVVVAQATLFASATQVMTSFATSRPRPRVYGDENPDPVDGVDARSFFSGHTATCLAATIATFRTLQIVRRPALAWTALGLGVLGTGFLSVARVGSGAHFPTDVAAGAVVGFAYGILLPAVHPLSESARDGVGARFGVHLITRRDQLGAAMAGSF